jgi:hypothetical protein
VNPKALLIEADTRDNTSCAVLRIDKTALSVQVIGTTCPATQVRVDSITPDWVRAGSSVLVTIAGSGFEAGMSISFENGSGKTPIASNVEVVNGDVIQATVSVPNGGTSADPVWDLRVGPARLRDAFTVIR